MPVLDIERKYIEGDIIGFIPDPVYAAALAKPAFYEAAPNVQDMPDRDTFLYRYLIKSLKDYYKDQNYQYKPQHQLDGTCGGQCSKTAKDNLAAVYSTVYDTVFPGRFSVAAEYGGGRVESGRQPGRWQGVAMSWLAGWSTKFGGLLLKDIPLDEEATREDELIALKWAASRDGVPSEYEAKAQNYLIEEAVTVRSAREAGDVIKNGGIIINGASYIPTGKRDSRGFSKIQRIAGGHATCWNAVRFNPFGLLYNQSWGMWGSGPTWPDDCPPWCVWLSEEDADTMIQGNTSETFGYVTRGALTPLNLPR